VSRSIEGAHVALQPRVRGAQPSIEICRCPAHLRAPGLKGRALSGPHGYEQIPPLVERSKRRVANFHADFNARLEEVPFVAGAHFSAADITAFVTVDFATAALKMPISEGCRAMHRWYETVAVRPSASV
jgi:glutathione S-transferase